MKKKLGQIGEKLGKSCKKSWTKIKQKVENKSWKKVGKKLKRSFNLFLKLREQIEKKYR